MNPMTEAPVVRLHRTLPAPPDQVYRAWLDPDMLRRWLAPGGLEVTRAEVDERVGGRYRIWHAEAGAEIGGFECELLELEPPERIVFAWGFAGPDRTEGPVYDSRLTISLSPSAGGGTDLTLVHERLDELHAAMPDVADNVEAGWESALDELVATMGRAA